MSDFDIFKDLGITAEDMQQVEAREKELAGTRKPTKKYELAIAVEAAIEKLAKELDGEIQIEHADSLDMVRIIRVEDIALMDGYVFPIFKAIINSVDAFMVEYDELQPEILMLWFIIRDVFTYDESAN